MSPLLARPNTVALVLLAVVLMPFVLRNPVWTDSAAILGVYALIAISVGLSYGQAGILTMSQGSFAALGAYAAAICTTRFGWPPFTDLVASLSLPALLAYGAARLVTRLTPLATALATLALGSLIEIAIRSSDTITGGFIGISGIPPLGPIATPGANAVFIWVIVAVVVLLYENLMQSAYGRAFNTLRDDQARAKADGIDVPALLSVNFALSAAIAGVAGWFYAHYISFLSPESLDTGLSISTLLMAVIGGAGTILGPIVGAILFDALTRFLPAAELQGFFYGLTLIVILIVARHGLLGLLRDAGLRLRRIRATREQSAAALDIEGAPT